MANCPYRALVCVVGNNTQGAASLALGYARFAPSGRSFSNQNYPNETNFCDSFGFVWFAKTALKAQKNVVFL